MIRLAHVSPLPPQPTGVADYCAALLPHLAQQLTVTAYTFAADAPSARPAHTLRRSDVDICLYHIGNQPTYHAEIAALALRHPGIVLLHEFDLRGLFLASGQPARFVQELGYAAGLDGLQQARAALAGQPLPPDAPLCQRLADVSLGVIVHTQQAAQTVRAVSRTPVVVIPHAAALPDAGRATAVSPLPPPLASLPPDTLLIGSFGFVAASKRIDVVLRALAQIRGDAPPFRYLLLGKRVDYDPDPLIAELGLDDIVIQTGYADEATFAAALQRVDVAVNLRSGPTGGEMSGALLRLLAHGRPTLVSDVGGFADFPDDVVVKITQDNTEVAQVAAALLRLLHDAAARQALGAAAQAHVAVHHAFPQVASQIADFVRGCVQTAVAEALTA